MWWMGLASGHIGLEGGTAGLADGWVKGEELAGVFVPVTLSQSQLASSQLCGNSATLELPWLLPQEPLPHQVTLLRGCPCLLCSSPRKIYRQKGSLLHWLVLLPNFTHCQTMYG